MKKTIVVFTLIIALFVSIGSFPVSAENQSSSFYNPDAEQYYDTLTEAFADAYPGESVYLVNDYELTSSEEIPLGKSLVIPTSAALNDTTTGNNASGPVDDYDHGYYKKLTVPYGMTLTVNGTLLVAGNQQSTQPQSGCLKGQYGQVNLEGEIVVNGSLYARGKIITGGFGKITANSGSSVYQLFQILDWRGGTETRNCYNAGVFPFNRFELNNIQVETDYMMGASLYGQYYIYASGTGKFGNVYIIGNNGLLNFDSSSVSTDKITFTWDGYESITATVHGPVSTGAITVSFQFLFWDIPISSGSMELPFGYNMDVEVANGGTLTLTNKIKLLPDCTLTVDDGGIFNVTSNGKLYVYDRTNYYDSYNFQSVVLPYADACLNNYGTINNSGVIASSDSGLSNIPCTSYNDTITIYEYEQNVGTQPVTFYIGE